MGAAGWRWMVGTGCEVDAGVDGWGGGEPTAAADVVGGGDGMAASGWCWIGVGGGSDASAPDDG